MVTVDSCEKLATGASLIECYKFDVGTSTYLYTSAAQPITISAISEDPFEPEPLIRSSPDLTAVGGNGMTVTVGRTNEIAAMFALTSPSDTVWFRYYRTFDGATDYVVPFAGFVQEVEFEGPRATITCAPITALLKTRVPLIAFQQQCPLVYGSTRCGHTSTAVDATLTAVAESGRLLTATAFGAHGAAYYLGGMIDAHTGITRQVAEHLTTSGNTVVRLNYPLPGLSVGNHVWITRGCARSEADCHAHTSGATPNSVNYLGMTQVPSRNPFQRRT